MKVKEWENMKCLYGECPSKELIRQEKRAGEAIGEITMGETYLIHRYFFQTKCIKYTDINNVYLMTEASESGDFGHEEYSLCVGDFSGKVWKLHADYKAYVTEAIDWIRKNYPQVRIGK